VRIRLRIPEFRWSLPGHLSGLKRIGTSRARRAIALSALLALALSAWPVVSGKTSPPRYTMESARRALDEARRAEEGRWAPEAIQLAESAMRVALVEHRRQQSRFFLRRDFHAARVAMSLAESKAHSAAEEAIRTREEARRRAAESMQEAEEALAAAGTFAGSMHLGAQPRTMLQRGRYALAEARVRHRDGDFLTADARAQEATTLAERIQQLGASKAARYTDPSMMRKWRRWVEETIAWSRNSGQLAIIVFKENHRVVLYAGGRPVKAYRGDMGYNASDTKLLSGDGATPEGRYQVTAKKGVGKSTYHKALALNYPNEEDVARFESAQRSGRVPRWARIGGQIEIHGEGGLGKDWTRGCVALSNRDIDDLFDRVAVGTPVTIVGTDGSAGIFTKLVNQHRNGGRSRRD
jgi:lipoprotein-anchoring transpeptidase ErfK/SrfK